jgi:hypothetical protein
VRRVADAALVPLERLVARLAMRRLSAGIHDIKLLSGARVLQPQDFRINIQRSIVCRRLTGTAGQERSKVKEL